MYWSLKEVEKNSPDGAQTYPDAHSFVICVVFKEFHVTRSRRGTLQVRATKIVDVSGEISKVHVMN